MSAPHSERPAVSRAGSRNHLTKRETERSTLRAQIEVLRAELESPRARVRANPAGDPELDPGLPSFTLATRALRRMSLSGVNRDEGLVEPVWLVNDKLGGRRFAEAHGLQVPAELGRWSRPEDIAWDELPDRFVLKSSRGSGGISVFPLQRRRDGRYFDHIGRREMAGDEVMAELLDRHRPNRAYFAEEFLTGRDGMSLPNDVKVFCVYGEPLFIEIRAEDWSRTTDTVQRIRTFLPDGTEIFDVRPMIPRGRDIEPPNDLPGIVAAATTLCTAIRRPSMRIDLYETQRGVVFGEITPNPGRPPALVPEWDRWFGERYEEACGRLLSDLVAEDALFVEFGPEDQS